MDQSIFRVPLKVARLSGFDKSFHNLLTTMPGTITPILFDELIPGSEVNVNMALSASLAPLASDTFMRCSIKCEAFFVPHRIVFGGFESYFTGINPDYIDGSGQHVNTYSVTTLPCFVSNQYSTGNYLAPAFVAGSLYDYLGVKQATVVPNGTSISLMPALAYHKIYSDWFRASAIQLDPFARLQTNVASLPTDDYHIAGSPWNLAVNGNSVYQLTAAPGASDTLLTYLPLYLADGHSIFETRQRNFGFDYFTTALPSAQQGSPLSVSTSGGSFTISSLRSANSLQQFAERQSLAGSRYIDHLRARYGANLSDGVADRSLFLGSAEFECYSKGVEAATAFATSTSYTKGNDKGNSQNPFSGIQGSVAGRMQSGGREGIISHFKANEPGYIFILATLVPRATYSSGLNKLLTRYGPSGSIADMANPILANVGPEPIYNYEVSTNFSTNIFGYTDRYASWKYGPGDQVHGLIRPSETLSSFSLNRSLIGASNQISSAFLEIPKNFMDNVSAIAGNVSKYGCWIDSFFDYKCSMPLPKYCLPSLQDPAYEHGRSISVVRGGLRF